MINFLKNRYFSHGTGAWVRRHQALNHSSYGCLLGLLLYPFHPIVGFLGPFMGGLTAEISQLFKPEKKDWVDKGMDLLEWTIGTAYLAIIVWRLGL